MGDLGRCDTRIGWISTIVLMAMPTEAPHALSLVLKMGRGPGLGLASSTPRTGPGPSHHALAGSFFVLLKVLPSWSQYVRSIRSTESMSLMGSAGTLVLNFSMSIYVGRGMA